MSKSLLRPGFHSWEIRHGGGESDAFIFKLGNDRKPMGSVQTSRVECYLPLVDGFAVKTLCQSFFKDFTDFVVFVHDQRRCGVGKVGLSDHAQVE